MQQKQVLRRTKKGGHFYSYLGETKEYPGLTSTLGIINEPWVTSWKLKTPRWKHITRRSQNVGIITHKYAEQRNKFPENGINHKLVDILSSDKEVYNAISAFECWIDEYRPIILGTEIQLIDPSVGFGCTLDAIVVIDDKIHVVDYKTSKSINKKHKIQVAMCANVARKQLTGGKECIPTLVHLNKKTGKQNMSKFKSAMYDLCEIGEDIVKMYNSYNRGVYGKDR